MWLMYLLPVIVIAGMLIYVSMAKARIRQAVAEGRGPQMFHDSYAGYFDDLGPDEHIIALWQGLTYTGSQSGAAQVAGALLNYASKNAVGISKYTPTLFVALTSAGRVLVSEEYSELGQRGNYKQVRAWPAGATATTGPSAVPGHSGPPPKNPFNAMVPLELAVVHGEGNEPYAAWLSPQSLEVTGQQRGIGTVLPMAPAQAAAIWQQANDRARAA